jgi:hypothetical protein
LTSILAITEVEPKDAIPKIKKYIHRINQSLNNTKSNQITQSGEKRFSATHVIKNLLRVIGESYPTVKIASEIADIKAPVMGDQGKFEQLFFYILLGILYRGEGEVLVELRQKDQFAVLTVLKSDSEFMEEALEQIAKVEEEAPDFKGRIQISREKGAVEAVFKLPLQFTVVKIEMPKEKAPTAKTQA